MYLRPLGLTGPIPIVHPILQEDKLNSRFYFEHKRFLNRDRNSIQWAAGAQSLWPQKKGLKHKKCQPLVIFLGRVGALTMLFYPEHNVVFHLKVHSFKAKAFSQSKCLS